ncbi:MAG: helix-turn-helix domain-containing protein [Sphingobium sp.]
MMNEGVVKSASRTIRILSIFADNKRPMRAGEISKIIDIPLSSCVALLETLVSENILIYDYKVREYFPGDRVRQIAGWLRPANVLEFSAKAAARRIGGMAGCCWAVGKAHGTHVRWLASDGGTEAMVGAQVPLCTSAAGLALLSLRDEDGIAYVVQEHNRLSSWDHIDGQKLTQQARKAAKHGYVVGPNGRNPLAHSLAIGLRSADEGEEDVVLCLFISEASFTRSQDHILRIVRGRIAYAYGEVASTKQPMPLPLVA